MVPSRLIALSLFLAPPLLAQHGPQPPIDRGYPDVAVVLITGGQWFDVHRGSFEPNQGILAVNGRFVSLGALPGLAAEAFVLQLEDDQFILPGIVDLHAHYNMELVGEGRIDETVYNPLIYLANGVTTTFSAGEYDPHEMVALREQVARGEKIGPRILTSGPYFGRANPEWHEDYTEVDVGSIEPGKLADLFVVRGNPLGDITRTRNVEVVMKAGRLYDPAALLEAARGRIGPQGPDDAHHWSRR
jgi:imidazolonepropionase-like amidohydrolase